jgi:hypothetical protein
MGGRVGDETRTHHHHSGSRLDLAGNHPCIFEGPARDATFEVGAGDGRKGRRRTRGDEQTVVLERGTIVEIYRAAVRTSVGLDRLPVQVANPQALEVARASALMRAVLIDAPAEDVRDRHAGIGLAGFAADQGDVACGVFMPQGFSGPDAGRTGTDNDVFHLYDLPCGTRIS